LTASVARIAKTETETSLSGRANTSPSAAFDASLDIEQADVLLRQTDQYAQWQQLRQKNDAEAKRLAGIVLARDALLQKQSKGESINWQEFDRLTTQLRQAGISLPAAQDIQGKKNNSPAPLSSATPSGDAQQASSPAAPAETLLNDDNMLVLSVVCPAVRLKQEVVGYGDEQTTLLPLGEVAHALDFAIAVDPKKRTASGWFISEDRTLSIDATKRTIKVDGKSYPWDDKAIAVGEDEIFVDSRLLSQWLPVDFKISMGELTATVEPREKLPLQTQLEREKKRQGLGKKEDTSLKYDALESPYALYSFPVMDVSLTSGVETDNSSKSGLQLNHSIVAEGDLARMTAKAYLSGNEEDPLDNARLTLERLDPGGKLLGPMQATKVAVGDVTPADLPVLGSSGTARGVSVSNADVNRSRDFDTTRFEGNMQPGWDVELYQNGNLINSVRVGADGRYLFEDVPVYFGANAFQLLALGPQGQKRMIESKDVNVGSGMLKAGKLEYNVSATQAKNLVPGFDEEESGIDEGARITSAFAYGVTDHLSVTAGVTSVEFDNVWHNYAQAGVNGTLSSVYGELDVIQDSAGGSGVSVQSQSVIGPFNLRAKHEVFSDFIEPSNPDNPLQSRTSAGVNGMIPEVLFMPPLSYTLSRDMSVRTEGETSRTNLRLAGSVGRIHLSNVIHWNDNAATAVSDAPMDGEFQATGSVGRGRVTAGVDYDLGDKNAVSQYKLSGLYPIAEKVSAGANLLRETGDDDGDEERTKAEVNLAFDAGTMMLTPKVSYDSEGNYGAFLTVSFSLGQDPVSKDLQMQSEKRSGKGTATAFVYHDANNNQVFDQDDTPLPEVKVAAKQLRKSGVTNEQGMAQLTNLSALTPTDVEVDANSLEDPFWQPAVPGVAVMPRSGSVQRLEFPIVSTGEIDGGVFFENSKGEKEPLSRVQLELRDEKGAVIKRTNPEYDGFYLFEKVFPGTYTLHVVSEDPQVKDLANEFSKEVVVGADGTIVRGADVVLRSPEAERGQEKRQEPQTPPTSKVRNDQPSPNAATTTQVAAADAAKSRVAASKPASPAAEQVVPVIQAAPKQKIPVSPARQTAAVMPAASIALAPLRIVSGSEHSPQTANPDALPASVVQPAPPPSPLADPQSFRPAMQTGNNGKHVSSPAPAAPAGAAAASNGRSQRYVVHLASYKSMKSAQAGIQILTKRLSGIVSPNDFTVTEVDLGKEKGVFFRVTCGKFGAKVDADRLVARMAPRTEYARSMLVKTSGNEGKSAAPPPLRSVQTGINPAAIAAKYAAMQQSR
jgi:hypothetical protein